MAVFLRRLQKKEAVGKRKYSIRVRASPQARLYILFGSMVLFGLCIAVRLFFLMVLEHNFYSTLAIGSHEMSRELFPIRGSIFVQDSRTGEEYPLAINLDSFLVFADTREITSDDDAEHIAEQLANTFSYTDEEKLALFLKLNKRSDPYEPIEDRVDEVTVNTLRALELRGIEFLRRSDRFYPEGPLAAQTVGFLGKNEKGESVGRYGIEGYWNGELQGKGGFLEGFRSATGGWIPLAHRVFQEPEDGADILLTIDRSVEHYACERLRKGFIEYEAESASLVMLDPKTGAIRALCSIPDFDPNTYQTAKTPSVYNNTAIFTPYEPGSIFKPMTMAAALDTDAVRPDSTFFDAGHRDGVCQKSIKNAGEKNYGTQTMTGILQNSINTGMVHVVEELGKNTFRDYVEAFGFGVKEGVELDTEGEGTIDALYEHARDALDCYTATASFGQGITVTPLQMATAFAAMVNGGVMMRPSIIDEIRYPDGRVERRHPKEIRQVISSRASTLISSMLVQVVEHGYGGRAKVPGYYVGGKTGTAQIPGPGGYTEDTNHSFVGFAPLDNPKFVMVIKYEKPKRTYAEVTAAPVFADIATFALQYYEVPPTR